MCIILNALPASSAITGELGNDCWTLFDRMQPVYKILVIDRGSSCFIVLHC